MAARGQLVALGSLLVAPLLQSLLLVALLPSLLWPSVAFVQALGVYLPSGMQAARGQPSLSCRPVAVVSAAAAFAAAAVSASAAALRVSGGFDPLQDLRWD